ncbi:hypothetical protein JXQ70_10875 [bacterium]|nr:hypothetical protein [bacterium]
MALKDLSESDQEIIFRCVGDILRGGFDLEDAEVLLGVTPDVLRAIEATWPPDDSQQDGEAFLAINNVLNETCEGLDALSPEVLPRIGVTREHVRAVYHRWARSHGLSWVGIR